MEEKVEESEAKLHREKTKKALRRRRNRRWIKVARLGCFRSGFDSSSTIDRKNEDGSVDMVAADSPKKNPTHLVVMVNGIVGSAENWRYAAKQFLKTYPEDVIVHCSERNTALLTLDGVDVMGERLADEVISVVERFPEVQKISFIGHSLGGLVARYAIALLYGRNYLNRLSKVNGQSENEGSTKASLEEKCEGRIAGLEPMNFITSATPHLGSRGHKQFPLLCGVHSLEIVARRVSWFLGRTGRHLMLTDNDNGKPPLLLRMASDSKDIPFLSALTSFKRRVAYANVRFDQLVGWCTSSLRRQNELPKRRYLSRNERYQHIVNVESAKSANAPQDHTLETTFDGWRSMKTEEMMDAMIRGLTRLDWERVDVKFNGGQQRILAHSSIQVQAYFIHSAGADVIRHMVDNFLL